MYKLLLFVLQKCFFFSFLARKIVKRGLNEKINENTSAHILDQKNT